MKHLLQITFSKYYTQITALERSVANYRGGLKDSLRTFSTPLYSLL